MIDWIDWIDMLAGGALVLAGWGLGRIQRKPKLDRYGDRQPICGCHHHRSFHGKGGCRKPVGVWRDPCSCTTYTGPEPLPEYVP